ncbi:hypothetical protein BS50DRAFT_590814 [Corynespora cassiicola Philippines]|uniref:Integral membrane protein-like protein n=1 Tax=Corynespora cassiicola Philippines TaxID=1448308 RepID=A0A2T2NED3_CORCC|nr:hypothetical protein BS50DRAFT_590814 [Corynespora cassiicola Philippines]
MSAMISQTLQGAVLSITSNIIAQAITSYKEDTPLTLDTSLIIKFAIFSIVSNPPNIVWQNFLEDLFPTNVSTAPHPKRDDDKAKQKPETQMSKTNVLIKFILDQTFGAVLNTLMFVVYMGYVNAPTGGNLGGAWDNVLRETREKFWPMIIDGYKFWPAVSLVSFLWIPVDKRIVFGCSVGVIWGIYLSLMVGA